MYLGLHDDYSNKRRLTWTANSPSGANSSNSLASKLRAPISPALSAHLTLAKYTSAFPSDRHTLRRCFLLARCLERSRSSDLKISMSS
eukprot:747254-Hanusia_phi.AAC.7